jgi:thioesterase domain-containing protein
MGNIQLSDTVDVDKMVMIDINSNAETDLLIDEDETNYSVLREQQRRTLGKAMKQSSAMHLAQNDQAAIEQTSNNAKGGADGKAHTRVHVAQLVSETADSSIDNRDDLQLQVPLNSRNDAVYLGTVWMGSPNS